MANYIKSIFIAIRPKTLSASISPVLVGSAIAFKSSIDSFDVNIFLLEAAVKNKNLDWQTI